MTLEEWLISNPRLVRTNTPPEILAAYMLQSLWIFEEHLLARAEHPFFKPGKQENDDGSRED